MRDSGPYWKSLQGTRITCRSGAHPTGQAPRWQVPSAQDHTASTKEVQRTLRPPQNHEQGKVLPLASPGAHQQASPVRGDAKVAPVVGRVALGGAGVTGGAPLIAGGCAKRLLTQNTSLGLPTMGGCPLHPRHESGLHRRAAPASPVPIVHDQDRTRRRWTKRARPGQGRARSQPFVAWRSSLTTGNHGTRDHAID